MVIIFPCSWKYADGSQARNLGPVNPSSLWPDHDLNSHVASGRLMIPSPVKRSENRTLRLPCSFRCQPCKYAES
jgi:hypothetical protein